MELFRQTNIDFLGKKWFFIGLSLALTAAGFASWIAKGSLKYGIDFTGGADITVPLGGFGQSGFGRDKSLHAFDGYTDLKTVWIRL